MPGSQEKTNSCLGFSIALTIFNLKLLFTHLNVSDSGTDCCHFTKTSGWQKSGNEGPFLQKHNGLHPHVPHSDTQVQSF